jgi:hypothetical protein
MKHTSSDAAIARRCAQQQACDEMAEKPVDEAACADGMPPRANSQTASPGRARSLGSTHGAAVGYRYNIAVPRDEQRWRVREQVRETVVHERCEEDTDEPSQLPCRTPKSPGPTSSAQPES